MRYHCTTSRFAAISEPSAEPLRVPGTAFYDGTRQFASLRRLLDATSFAAHLGHRDPARPSWAYDRPAQMPEWRILKTDLLEASLSTVEFRPSPRPGEWHPLTNQRRARGCRLDSTAPSLMINPLAMTRANTTYDVTQRLPSQLLLQSGY
jgi:hypothetical protein